MNRTLLITVLIMLCIGASEAQAQTAAFTRMGFGARGIALGNALVADGSGDAAPFYNPSLAPFAGRQYLEATSAFLTLDRELQFLQIVAPLKPRAGIAAGLIHAGVGNIDGRGLSQNHTQTYSTDEFAFFLAFGLKLGSRLTGGFGLQVFRSDLIDDLSPVNSIGVDLGLTARVTDALRLGVTVEDLLARYSWDTSSLYGSNGKTTSDQFPVRVRLGASYTLLDGRGLLLAEYESRASTLQARTSTTEIISGMPFQSRTDDKLTIQENRIRLGAEFFPIQALALRAGIDGLGDGQAKPSAGFMIRQEVGNLLVSGEYAVMLEPYGTMPMHFITLRVHL